MPRILEHITLWTPQRTAVIPVPEPVLDSLAVNPEITHRLSLPSELVLTFHVGCKIIRGVGEPYELTQGKLLRLTYDDGSITEWRILSVGREFSGSENPVVRAEPIWEDLKKSTVRQRLVTGYVRTSLSFFNRTLEDIVTDLLSTQYNAPFLFEAGTVDPALNEGRYNVVFNASTHMDALRQVCDRAEAEWEAVYDPQSDRYRINFYESPNMGGGEEEADLRPVGIGGGKRNRIELHREQEGDEYFSRIVPLAGQGNEIQNTGGARWKIDGHSFEGGNTVIELADDAIVKDGYGTMASQDVYFAGRRVVETRKPNIVVVQGEIVPPEDGSFRAGDSSTQMVFIEDPEAVGHIGIHERRYNRPDISPYSNLIREAGISADMSEWSGGTPVGIEKITGLETVDQSSSSLFVRHGSLSARVEAIRNHGVQTKWIPVSPQDDDPYFSFMVYVQVEQGAVRIDLIDETGRIHPREDEVAGSNINEIRAISVGGLEFKANNVRIRVRADSEDAVFFIDAMTFTQTATPWDFSPLMGPKDLWIEGSKYLKRYGGSNPDRWTGTVYDESHMADGFEEITIGSWVRIFEDYDADTQEWLTSFDARVVELSYSETNGGRLEKEMVLADKTSDFSRPFTQQFLNTSSQQSELSVSHGKNIKPFLNYAEIFRVGIITADLAGTYTEIPVELIVKVRQGTDYVIADAINSKIIAITATEDAGPGELDLGIEEQVIVAPEGSFILKLGGQEQAEEIAVPGFDFVGDSLQIINNELQATLEIIQGTLDDLANGVLFHKTAAEALNAAGIPLLEKLQGTLDDLQDGIDFQKTSAQALNEDGIPLLEQLLGTLDDIADGSTYAKTSSSSLDNDGLVLLATTVGNLDDIDDGSVYGRIDRANLTASGLVLLSVAVGDLDDIQDGTVSGKIQRASLTAEGLVLLSGTVGDLDDIDDGVDWRRVTSAQLTAEGLVLLAQTVGSLDDIDDGNNHGKVQKASLTAQGLVLLSATSGTIDDIDDGSTYGRINKTSINSSGVVILSGSIGDLDDIADGSVHGRVQQASLTANGLVLLDATVGDLDDIDDGGLYGRVSQASLTASGLVLLSTASGNIGDIADGGGYQKTNSTSINAQGFVILSTTIGNLGDVSDGGGYAKVSQTSVSSGKIVLAETEGTLDDIANGNTFGRVNLTQLTSGNILLAQTVGNLDDIDNGSTHGKVRLTSLSSGQILLAEVIGDLGDIQDGGGYQRVASAQLNTSGLVLLSAVVGDLSDIDNGGGYSKVLATNVSAGNIKILGPDGQTVIDQGVIFTDQIFASEVTITNSLTLGSGGMHMWSGGRLASDGIRLNGTNVWGAGSALRWWSNGQVSTIWSTNLGVIKMEGNRVDFDMPITVAGTTTVNGPTFHHGAVTINGNVTLSPGTGTAVSFTDTRATYNRNLRVRNVSEANRNSPSPLPGDIIFNTTSGRFNGYNGSEWRNLE